MSNSKQKLEMVVNEPPSVVDQFAQVSPESAVEQRFNALTSREPSVSDAQLLEH